MPKISRRRFRRLFTLIKPFFVGDLRGWAWGLLGLLVGLCLLIKGIDVWMSYIGRDFMTSLSLRKQDDFIHYLIIYVIAFAVATPVVVFYRYTEERLGLLWRQWFSQKIITRYLSHRAYYKLSWFEGIDNPDQRIEEDVRSFTTTSLSLFLIFLQSTFALFAFIGVLSSISWWLVLTALLYAALGSVCTFYLGRPLIGLNYAQLQKEADYRYKLIKVRDYAESVAFYRGEAREITRVRQRLKDVVKNMILIVNRNRTMNLFTFGYNYLVIILPTVVVAPLYLNGHIEFGVVTQAGMAFGQVLNALSVIVHNFGSLSAYAAVVKRLGAFSEALDNASADNVDDGEAIVVSEGSRLAFTGVTIYTPKRDQVLVRNLSLELPSGGLFVTGASGSGKSSILRVVSGLWSAGQGHIERPPMNECMFVPQRPYMVIGDLRSQLLYAQQRPGIRDMLLVDSLQRVGLYETFRRVGGLDEIVDWNSILSTGEQQRLAFARVILARPKYVFLDEATTALDEQGEEDLYTLLKDFAQTIVTVGYRANLKKFHTKMLVLKGDGSWRISDL